MSGKDFIDKYGDNLIKSYTSLKVKFQFPASVMYPNLAVRLDKGSVMYPLSGISFCTGLEILLAHKLGCKFTVLGGVIYSFLKYKRNWTRCISQIILLDAKLSVNKVLSKLYHYKSIGFVNTYGNEWEKFYFICKKSLHRFWYWL